MLTVSVSVVGLVVLVLGFLVGLAVLAAVVVGVVLLVRHLSKPATSQPQPPAPGS